MGVPLPLTRPAPRLRTPTRASSPASPRAGLRKPIRASSSASPRAVLRNLTRASSSPSPRAVLRNLTRATSPVPAQRSTAFAKENRDTPQFIFANAVFGWTRRRGAGKRGGALQEGRRQTRRRGERR